MLLELSRGDISGRDHCFEVKVELEKVDDEFHYGAGRPLFQVRVGGSVCVRYRGLGFNIPYLSQMICTNTRGIFRIKRYLKEKTKNLMLRAHPRSHCDSAFFLIGKVSKARGHAA